MAPSSMLRPLLLLIGVCLGVLSDDRLVRPLTYLVVLGTVVLLALIPRSRRAVLDAAAWIDRLPKRADWIAIPLAFIAGTYFVLGARFDGTATRPVIHDEFVYIIQSRMVAEGRLAMPMHPLGEFLESCYLIVDGSYAGQYFVGAPVWFAGAALTGIDHSIWSCLTAGLAVGVAYLSLRQFVARSTALAVAIVALASPIARLVAPMVLSQSLVLLLSASATLMVALASRTGSRVWLIGAASSLAWLIVTRPLDGMCVAIPLLGWLLWQKPTQWRRLALTVVLAAGPWAILQGLANVAATGSFVKTAFAEVIDRDMPGVRLGFGTDTTPAEPRTESPRKIDFYQQSVMPVLSEHTPRRAVADWFGYRGSAFVRSMFAEPLLVGLLLLGLTSRRTEALLGAATVLLFVAGYTLWPFVLLHYNAVAWLGTALVVAAGIESARNSAPAWRMIAVVLPAVASMALVPGVTRVPGPPPALNVLENLTLKAAGTIEGRAVLFIRRPNGLSAEMECVYNHDVAWPDDARVVRLHDLGSRNARAIDYYTRIQPDRRFFLLDPLDQSLTPLPSP